MKPAIPKASYGGRRNFIGGSDARVIMGSDETALIRLWREKRGEVEPEDLSDNLVVQLGVVTEQLNRRWFERSTRAADQGRPNAGLPPKAPLDWSHPRRHGLDNRGRLQVEIYAAVVILGGDRRPKIYAATSAQHVGHERRDLCTLRHHGGRQMG